MRFAAIADVHGNYLALDAVLADIHAQGVGEIVNLGDMASGPLDARRTMDALMALDAVHVLGNHDRYLIDRPPEKMGSWDRPAYAQLNRHHLDWLRAQPAGKPIYMQAPFCDGLIPAAVPYPLERMVEQFGRYFTSSIGYMLALAIADGYTWIGLYGIDLASDIEYQQQRANAEYLIGWARGLGRTVVLATGSAICQAGHLYGYEPPIAAVGGMGAAVRNHIASLKKKHEETLATLNTLDGALQESDNFLKLMDYKERGVQVTSY